MHTNDPDVVRILREDGSLDELALRRPAFGGDPDSHAEHALSPVLGPEQIVAIYKHLVLVRTLRQKARRAQQAKSTSRLRQEQALTHYRRTNQQASQRQFIDGKSSRKSWTTIPIARTAVANLEFLKMQSPAAYSRLRRVDAPARRAGALDAEIRASFIARIWVLLAIAGTLGAIIVATMVDHAWQRWR